MNVKAHALTFRQMYKHCAPKEPLCALKPTQNWLQPVWIRQTVLTAQLVVKPLPMMAARTQLVPVDVAAPVAALATKSDRDNS